MRRLTRVIATITAVSAVAISAGCRDSGTSEEPAAVLTPVALAQALASDREATLAAYRDKVLELTGTVEGKIEPSGLNDTRGVVFAGIDERLAFDANLSFVAFDADDPAAVSEFERLAVGDSVTVRCRLVVLNESGSLFLVKSCRVV